jgi:methylthioribose-1-phosphate isomerase
MIVEAVKWIGDIDGYLELIDQRRLPAEFTRLQCRDVETLFEAIKTLAVRGAPAIGVSAAYGLVLALQKLDTNESIEKSLAVLKHAREYLASSRPTAVNLFWALDRVWQAASPESQLEPAVKPPAKYLTPHSTRDPAASPVETLQQLREVILREANAIYQEDVDMCRRIGQHGEKFIKDGAGILTHCNAGALATAGQGTALSPMFEAHKKGKKFKVYADETRPLLQGARLTAWELKQAGIDVTVICDNMAGWLMKQGKINAVITGADRIAANGDTANKIGTYSLSILAREHGVPLYIAAPSSTFDLSIKSGAEIPIEQRSAEEVTKFAGTQTAPAGVDVYNPAFDVTEAKDIAAIITETGVIENPNLENIARILGTCDI